MKKRNFLFCCTGDQYKGPLYFAGFWRGAKVLVVGLLVGGAAVVGAPLALSAVGFSSTGIVAGSIAAKMMSMAAIANGGGVAAGGIIAAAQSAGAAGIGTFTNVLIGTITGSGGAIVAKKMFKEESQGLCSTNSFIFVSYLSVDEKLC